ncbi:hypothetical protein [Nitrosovibrio sp. Nv6]|uniref:hypothetical protein n=1 Tax=Nitrosovibrio sp. Nv6 TaxID=1855340 RepID=UPI0008AB05EE|nr:hypothetical protein [Nitrosovibrio sp. Nv6]SEO63920.1 hypothetical protein SAMN05216316_0681 [Nitrosovibrio sp. Nv6]
MIEQLANQPLYPARIDYSHPIGRRTRFALIGSGVPPELCNAIQPGGTIGVTEATPGGTAYVLPATPTTWTKVITDLDPIVSGSFTVHWHGIIRANTSQRLLRSNGATYGWNFVSGTWSAGFITFGLFKIWGGSGYSAPAVSIVDGTEHSVTIVYDSVAAAVEVFLDGVSIGSGSWTPDPGAMGAGQVFSVNGHSTAPHKMLSVQAFTGALSASEIAALAANSWLAFEPEPDEIWVAAPSAGAAALEGVAQAVAAATGTLTTAITLAANAESQAAGSGALATQINLTADAVSISTAGGVLTAQIQLSGAALAQAISTAALSSGINLSASAVAEASADGMLDTIIKLIGSAVANASASADLTTTPGGFAANAICQAIATGELATQIQLSGDAIAEAIATGSLTTQIQLAAAAIAEALASGTLSEPLPLVSDPRFVAQGRGRNGVSAARPRGYTSSITIH